MREVTGAVVVTAERQLRAAFHHAVWSEAEVIAWIASVLHASNGDASLAA